MHDIPDSQPNLELEKKNLFSLLIKWKNYIVNYFSFIQGLWICYIIFIFLARKES